MEKADWTLVTLCFLPRQATKLTIAVQKTRLIAMRVPYPAPVSTKEGDTPVTSPSEVEELELRTQWVGVVDPVLGLVDPVMH